MDFKTKTDLKRAHRITIFGLLLISSQGWGLPLVSSSSDIAARPFLKAAPQASVSIARVNRQRPFGTGQGRNLAPAPLTFQLENGQTRTAFIERQKNEANALLILTDGKADQILQKIELPSESASGAKTLLTKRGTFLAVFGDSLAGKNGGEELFIIDPQTGKIREFLLSSGANKGRTLFPQIAGEPLVVFNGKNTFEVYDTSFMKKINQWDLPDLSREDFENTFLARIPGQADHLLLLSDHKASMVNTATKKIEWTRPGNFATHSGVTATSQGPVLYRADFHADPKTGRQSVHTLNLLDGVTRSFEIGDGNVIVNGIEIKERGGTPLMMVLTKHQDATSELSFINLSTGKVEERVPVPSTVSNMKFLSFEEGAEPLVLLSRPGHLPLDRAEDSLYSLGYVYALDGRLQTILEFAGGLKAQPLVVQEGNRIHFHYQAMLTDSLNRLTWSQAQN